ncbi:MAG: ATP-dependent RecD-like DNA helicase [Lachnospiraceae bacterium]|nr:ATP-dependent RecD-like DNA helicase [Lachnospiraceae bacterium]
MSSLSGYVEKIVYRNSDNGYTVLTVADKNDETTCVGTFQYISEGEYVEMEGDYVTHPSYGEQLSVRTYEIKEPEDEKAIVRYLGSGAIKGIGPALADRIVRHFKEDTFRIIEEEPERLQEVKGISKRIAMDIASQLEEKKDMRKAMIFLQQYGMSMNLAVKIYHTYGPEMYNIIKKNPYKLADDIEGVGFKIADEIAMKAGISENSDFRIKSGISYVLSLAGVNGHVYLPEEELLRETGAMLGIGNIDDIEKYLMDMVIDKKIVVKKTPQGNRVYSSTYYYAELNIAAKLKELDISESVPEEKLVKKIAAIEKENGIMLDELQRQAVMEAANCGILVVTGGPGTGKTTTINTIIHYFESQGMEILLAAPTGRAAKRMTDATGHEAQTVHRMLEIMGVPEEDTKGTEHIGMHFEKNEMNPLEADVVIIDEMSMVDMFLMNSLLRAVTPGTKLILVGDSNQLPSVGPGNVLKDIINSERYHVVRLTKIFRQATQSDIVVNAHKINHGEQVSLDNHSKDFLFIRRSEVNQIINATITLVREKLPKYVNAEIQDIQVLTPMRKGALGVERLNEILQHYLNPADDHKREKESGSGVFREGDKVMQVKNNYQTTWEKRGYHGVVLEEGMGVFNGDMGIIRKINLYAENLEVEFEDGKFVTYPFKQLDELELAYAVTIHKSQGSEYPAVVLPLLTGPRMLMTRNLLYTGVTRAKQCVCIVGMENAVQEMIANESEQKRYSSLDERIRES